MHKNKLFWIVLFFSIIGLFTSLYLTWDHYRVENGVLCEINDGFSCDITKNSKYAELFNVPVGVFGMIWFLVMLGLNYAVRKRDVHHLLLVWGGFGLLFVGYFVHGEYVLKALCPYCTIAHFCVILIFIANVDLFRKREVK
jgi:uncharacterized membrane protein